MMKLFQSWSKWELGWLAVFSFIAVLLSCIWQDTLFGFSVFFTGVVCVVLVARGGIWNYAWGTYNVIGYAYLSYINGYFGEVMLNAGFFLPMQLVGFLMWKRNMNKSKVKMKRMNLVQIALVLLMAAGITFGYGTILENISGQNAPFLDSASTVLSVIAMILMAMRYAEQWLLWIIVNIVSITLWSLRLGSGVEGAAPMVVMWSAYLVNAVYGYWTWMKRSRITSRVSHA